MLFLIGPTRSGKGTTVRILARLVGEQNLAGPTLGSLTGQFGLGPLYGKSVAVVSDARLSGRADTSVIVERLLSITGEDVQNVDRKHLRQVDVKLGTRIVIASNELPKLNDASGALVNRMILIRFTKSYLGKEDTRLTDKLSGELPGILLWALDGLDRLRERGRFVQPPSSAELIQDMAELSSPISAFVRDRVILDRTATTPVKEAFQEWKRWCEDHGRDHPGTEQSFGRELRAAVPTITSAQQRGHDGVRFRMYRGIRLRGAFDDQSDSCTAQHPSGQRSQELEPSESIEF
jgi:putative DNA primase/helicase